MRDGGGAVLVDEGSGGETLQRERLGVRGGPSLRDRVREAVADAGRRLEAAGAPAAVEIQVLDRGEPDDRRGVRADVDDAGPGPQQVRPREHREQLQRGGHLLLDDVEGTALAIAVVAVD